MEIGCLQRLYKNKPRIVLKHLISGYQKDIWIIGSSIVTRASEHAHIRPIGDSLGLEKIGCELVWIGMSGMKWQNLVSLVQSILNWRSIPFSVIIHCGGNDIGDTPCGELLYHMKFTIAILSKMLPDTALVWSNILPRYKWRFSNNTGAMETTRRRINRGMRSYLLKIGGYVIKHTDFEDKHVNLFSEDGVHLSFIGNEIFLNQIQCTLDCLVNFKFPHCLGFPYNE